MPEDPQYCDGSIRWLAVEDLEKLNRLVITSFTPDEKTGVLKPNELASAQAAPAAYRYYEQTNDVAILAAVLLQRIIQNHPFNSANKRTGLSAAIVFCRINGYSFSPAQDEALDVCQGIASHAYDLNEISNWIANNSQPSDSADLVSEIFFEFARGVFPSM